MEKVVGALRSPTTNDDRAFFVSAGAITSRRRFALYTFQFSGARYERTDCRQIPADRSKPIVLDAAPTCDRRNVRLSASFWKVDRNLLV
jgi:hypothetical protein